MPFLLKSQSFGMNEYTVFGLTQSRSQVLVKIWVAMFQYSEFWLILLAVFETCLTCRTKKNKVSVNCGPIATLEAQLARSKTSMMACLPE